MRSFTLEENVTIKTLNVNAEISTKCFTWNFYGIQIKPFSKPYLIWNEDEVKLITTNNFKLESLGG